MVVTSNELRCSMGMFALSSSSDQSLNRRKKTLGPFFDFGIHLETNREPCPPRRQSPVRGEVFEYTT